MDLAGRSAVVAGGAGGLGSATVRHLAGLGVGVVVLDPDAEKGASLADELGDRVTSVAGDSNDDEAVGVAIAHARARGVFSIAVSATGVVIRSPRLVDVEGNVIPKEILQANLDLHVVGPFNLARLAAAAFAGNDPDDDGQRGVIVQTGEVIRLDAGTRLGPEMGIT